uniref:MIP18 family-like domain-containing protein n=2 Tax=Chenopodium quinoa TaxID=63459 RepID=A0A803MGD6_CHEQI
MASNFQMIILPFNPHDCTIVLGASTSSIKEAESDVLKALSQIISLDFGTDIVSCGFVKDLQIDETSGEVSFRLELTTPACPVKDMFEQKANEVVAALPWVRKVNVTMSAQPAKPVFGGDLPKGLQTISNIVAEPLGKNNKRTWTLKFLYLLNSRIICFVSIMVSYTDLEQEIVEDVNQQQLHNPSKPGEINEIGIMAKDQVIPASVTTGSQQKERRSYNPKTRLQPIQFSPMIVPLSTRDDQNGVAARFEAHVKELVDKVKSTSLETVREATPELMILAKDLDNQIIIASCGAIDPLVNLLRSSDMNTQEKTVTAVMNLSISNNNKVNIMKAESIKPLIHVLQTGTPEARENAAATLYSLFVFEENKIRIGNSGAIDELVELLGNGTPRGRMDAATALFYLSIHTDNRHL